MLKNIDKNESREIRKARHAVTRIVKSYMPNVTDRQKSRALKGIVRNITDDSVVDKKQAVENLLGVVLTMEQYTELFDAAQPLKRAGPMEEEPGSPEEASTEAHEGSD
ncbi:hypothetical protein FEM48_Zijuj02G0067400 [Ziziphus jujuba var. spinosa]|uniref:Uncharacterized protein n=1 Tax=Ziziphus jujuba var. spinosa TaxID=714518 RepID=A0A978VU86_ZIZJJ|nr:hypothetical protein FEM48_Zijuj02G0067000 [Ziziphus jujuba var. spinosa]KAH7542381.1 hypothetical protein FEM48_Zijuj02G0067400 [Ziziphus jujuba var. spinosa]